MKNSTNNKLDALMDNALSGVVVALILFIKLIFSGGDVFSSLILLAVPIGYAIVISSLYGIISYTSDKLSYYRKEK